MLRENFDRLLDRQSTLGQNVYKLDWYCRRRKISDGLCRKHRETHQQPLSVPAAVGSMIMQTFELVEGNRSVQV
jgi:hypothetical protein